jgi:hypothetical protein
MNETVQKHQNNLLDVLPSGFDFLNEVITRLHFAFTREIDAMGRQRLL